MMLRPFESENNIFATVGIRDLSLRKAAEEQLARAERKYHGLLEAAPYAILIVTAKRDRTAESTDGDSVRLSP